MFTKKNLKQKFVDYYLILITLLFILSSKTVYFGYLRPNKYYTLGLLMIMCIGLLMLKRIKIVRTNFHRMLVLSILMISSIAWNSSSLDSSYINGILGLLIALVTGMLLVTQSSKVKFVSNYVNLISIISMLSLLFFNILIFLPELVQKLGATEYRVDWSASIIYSPFYTWGWWSLWNRNASMWTEPGFFQMFIVFAIMMIISYPKEIRYPNRKMLLLFITLLTTQSTTAYLILIIIIFTQKDYFKRAITKYGHREESKFLVFMISMVIIATIAYVISSGVIQDKISTDNSSMMLRTTDFFKSLQIIGDNPVFGIGFGEKMEKIVESYGIASNSNGLFSMIYIWGLPFVIFYMYQYIAGIIIFFEVETRMKKLGLILIVFIIFISQVFWWYPFFNIFFFEWKGNKDEV